MKRVHSFLFLFTCFLPLFVQAEENGACSPLVKVESSVIGVANKEDFRKLYTYSGKKQYNVSVETLDNLSINFHLFDNDKEHCLREISVVNRRVQIEVAGKGLYWVPLSRYKYSQFSLIPKK